MPRAIRSRLLVAARPVRVPTEVLAVDRIAVRVGAARIGHAGGSSSGVTASSGRSRAVVRLVQVAARRAIVSLATVTARLAIARLAITTGLFVAAGSAVAA